MMKKISVLIALLPVLCAAAITGTYQATFNGPNGDKRQVTFAFIEQGGKLTGYVSNPSGDSPIVDGHVDGNQITFVVERDGPVDVEKVNYTGRVNGDSIVIQLPGFGGRTGRELTAVRTSAETPRPLPPAKPKIVLPPLQPVPSNGLAKRRPWAGTVGTSFNPKWTTKWFVKLPTPW